MDKKRKVSALCQQRGSVVFDVAVARRSGVPACCSGTGGAGVLKYVVASHFISVGSRTYLPGVLGTYPLTGVGTVSQRGTTPQLKKNTSNPIQKKRRTSGVEAAP